MLPNRQITRLYETLGATICESRKEKGYTQSKFAELLKISRASLVNIEKGRQRPPIHNLYEIARLLNITIYELLPEQIPNEADQENIQKIEQKILALSAGNTDILEKLTIFVNTKNKK